MQVLVCLQKPIKIFHKITRVLHDYSELQVFSKVSQDPGRKFQILNFLEFPMKSRDSEHQGSSITELRQKEKNV